VGGGQTKKRKKERNEKMSEKIKFVNPFDDDKEINVQEPKEPVKKKKDVVGDYIAIKLLEKDIAERLDALKKVILDKHRDDPRIKIMPATETIVIKPDTYERLEAVGIQTEITETRKKKLEEFDVAVQKVILDNPENYEKKITRREWIKIIEKGSVK